MILNTKTLISRNIIYSNKHNKTIRNNIKKNNKYIEY